MSDNTKIEWTDATWNPVTGCSVVSPGCTNCYAMRLAGTRLRHHPSRIDLTDESKAGPVWNGTVKLNEEWLDQPLRWRKSRRIFVCAHGDLFHEAVPDEWIDRVFATMALADHHIFQVLTKRADRMRAWVRNDRNFGVVLQHWKNKAAGQNTWPLANVHLGVSVENQAAADERIPLLLQTPAAVRFISAEPLLGPIDLMRNYYDEDGIALNILNGGVNRPGGVRLSFSIPDQPNPRAGLDWVIAGGESGPRARPSHPDWFRSLRDQCVAAEVPFFFKQWGSWVDIDNGPADDDVYEGCPMRWIDTDGFAHDGSLGVDFFHGTTSVYRIGKRLSGRLLDGRVWDQFAEQKE